MGLRSRRAAIILTSASAAVLIAVGAISTLVAPDAAPRADSVPEAPATSAAPSPAATAAEAGELDAPTTEPAASGAAGTALEVLATLEVKGRAPKTGYDRDQFGQRWLDVDRNGCDTRNDILTRDLAETTSSGSCTVLTGRLADPYTATTIDFVRGQDTSADVQIDHVVALSDAWQKGAQSLSAEQRAAFANDPLNLLAVDGPANAQKGDGDAATWLPSNRSFRCAYVARQVSVKAAYALWVTPAEHDAIARVLADCPDEPALAEGASAGSGVASEPAPAPAPPAPAEPAAPVFYANCAAVRAAGAAPIRDGDPGYSHTLDRDKDGIACE